jgi:hypothetical protein
MDTPKPRKPEGKRLSACIPVHVTAAEAVAITAAAEAAMMSRAAFCRRLLLLGLRQEVSDGG